MTCIRAYEAIADIRSIFTDTHIKLFLNRVKLENVIDKVEAFEYFLESFNKGLRLCHYVTLRFNNGIDKNFVETLLK